MQDTPPIHLSRKESFYYAVENGREWAKFFIHPRINGVELVIYSTYGVWATTWTAIGDDWIDFFRKINKGYLFSKLKGTETRIVDVPSVLETLRERVSDLVEGGVIDDEDALSAFETLNDNHYDPTDPNLIETIRYDLSLDIFTDHDDPVCHTLGPAADQFWDRLWRPWIEQVHQEEGQPL